METSSNWPSLVSPINFRVKFLSAGIVVCVMFVINYLSFIVRTCPEIGVRYSVATRSRFDCCALFNTLS